MTIKQQCVFYSIWINHHENNNIWSKILIKLVLTIKYNIKLKDWNIDYIKNIENIENTYNKILRGIYSQI